MNRNHSFELSVDGSSHTQSKTNRVPYMGCQSLLYQNKINKETVLRHTKSIYLSSEEISPVPTSVLIHQSSPQSIPSFSTYHSNEYLSNMTYKNNDYVFDNYDIPPIETITPVNFSKQNSVYSNQSFCIQKNYPDYSFPPATTPNFNKNFLSSCVGRKSPSIPRNMNLANKMNANDNLAEDEFLVTETFPSRRPVSCDMGNSWNEFLTSFFTSGSKGTLWTRHSIKQSILNYVPKNEGKHAARIFKIIQKYMGDRRTRKSPSQLIALLQYYVSFNEDLRDEVLIQICKQTTNNPDIRSTCRGWELLSECLLQFTPSQKLFPYFVDFISSSISNELRKDPSCLNTNLANLQKCEYHLSWAVKKNNSEFIESLDSSRVTICSNKRKRSFTDKNRNVVEDPVIYSPQNLSDLMKQQSFSFPNEGLPLELIVLCNQLVEDIDKADSFLMLYGSFNDPKLVRKVSINLEKWFNTSCRKGPHLVDRKNIPNLQFIALHVLIYWFQSLSQPIISSKLIYENNFSIKNLDSINRRVLLHMVNFCQIHVINKSKDSLENMASFLCAIMFQLPNDRFYPLTSPIDSVFMNIILTIFHNLQAK